MKLLQFAIKAALALVVFASQHASGQTIDYTPLFTSSTFSKTVDVSKPVGVTEGASGI